MQLTDGTNTYEMLEGTIRNTGSGWSFISDSGHAPIGFGSITVTSSHIELAYGFTGTKVCGFQVTPDETFAGIGLRVGASVGTTSAVLSLYRQPTDRISDYIEWNGSAWTSLNGVFSVSYSGSTMTLTHEDMGTAATSPTQAVALANRGQANCQAGAITATTTQLAFYTGAYGSQVGAGAPTSSNHRVYVTRYGRRLAVPAEDPTTITSSTGNIWVSGLIQVS